ncbi:MAG TPA: TraX family protein, partial [Clostridia bacterium]|nr:TraX family protein [Clostridia bacterium]
MKNGRTLTANHIKLIAITAMTADHLAWWLLPSYSLNGQFVHFVGRLTAPLMCLFIAEGCLHTSNLKRYIGRLFVFAVLSHFPYVIYFGFKWYSTTSIIATFLIGLVAASFYKRYANKPMLSFLFITFCCILAYRLDWSYIAVLWIVSAYILRDNK